MSIFTKEKLEEIIESNNFDKLKEQYENEWFECKSQPYLLAENKGKRELAKDVSSFANSNGGYILIGVKTKKDDAHFGDKISEIRPFEPALASREQILKVCEEWIYPKPDGLDFNWIASKDDLTKGLAVIKIPAQSDALKPFLIKNVLDEDKQIEIMFGYAERIRDNSQPYNLRDIQSILRLGLNYEKSIQRRFDALETRIENLSERSDGKNTYEHIEEITKIAVNEANLTNERFFALTAFTEKPNTLNSFAKSKNGAKQLLLETPSIRDGGWTLEAPNTPEIIKGELIRTKEEEYKIIELHRDGTFIFAVAADGKFLSWGRKWGDNDKINQVALIESVFNFVSLYEKVIESLEEKPNEIAIRIELSNMHKDDKKNYLAPYSIDHFSSSFHNKTAPENSMVRIIKSSTENLDFRVLAFKIVREIYLWFGFDEDKIPYTKTENDVKMIDPEQIKNLN